MSTVEYVAIFLLLLIIVLSVWVLVSMRGITEHFAESLDAAQALVLSEAWDAAAEKISEIALEWDALSKQLRYIIHHETIAGFSDALSGAREACRNADPLDTCQGITAANHVLDRIYREQLPLPENVF